MEIAVAIFAPLCGSLSIDLQEFQQFAVRCKTFYERRKNPFHNFRHGLSVLFSSNHFFLQCDFMRLNFTDRQVFAFLLAAFGHDLDHTGRNNDFEIHSRSPLAMKYNDQSPLEQHHIRTLFKAINASENSVLSRFDFKGYFEIRGIIIECILATDMKAHHALLGRFEGLLDSPTRAPSPEEKRLVLALLTHSADISGSAKHLSVAEKWSRLITQEFAEQYRLEQEMGLPLTPFFKDLHLEVSCWKSEVAFLNLLVRPLFELLQRYDFGPSRVEAEQSPTALQAQNYFAEIVAIIRTNIGAYEARLAGADQPRRPSKRRNSKLNN